MSTAKTQKGARPVRRGPIISSRGAWDKYVEWYPLPLLSAPHDPDREDDLAAITESMKNVGWSGRPLLASRYDDGPLICQTGSHRLAAARAAGLDAVPVVVVDCTPELECEEQRDVFEMMIEYAEEGGADSIAAVRELWAQDGYPQADASVRTS